MKKLWLIILCSITSSTHYLMSETKENPFLDKKNCNPEELLKSLQQKLLNPYYRREILPSDFSCIHELLDFAQKNNLERAFYKRTFQAFNKILKTSDWINAYIFESFITQIADYVKDQCIPYKNQPLIHQMSLVDLELYDRFSTMVNNHVVSQFTGNYVQFKQDPIVFLKNISSQVTQFAQEELEVEQLRQIIIRFLDTCIAKLVWCPQKAKQSWQSVKNIAHQLSVLMEDGIIDDIDDLDDLYWTLMSRFCLFIEISSIELPLDFYQLIKKDMAEQELLFLELEEQESFIETKIAALQRTIVTAEAKRLAYEKGLITC